MAILVVDDSPDELFLATAIWVCPGNVFSGEEKPGCTPFQEDRGSVTIEPTTPSIPGPVPAPPIAPSDRFRGRKAPASSMDTEPASVNTQLCTLYKEYINLELKTQGGFKFGDTDESERWQTLKRLFQTSPVPSCS